jgi:cyclophilin family peptidyl-prolyl cis-trans isomerase/predicted small lipoprotein YifL
MKRLLVSAALVAALVSVTSCGSKQKAGPETGAPAESTAAPTAQLARPPAPIDDPAIQQIDQFITDAKIDKGNPNWKTSLPKPPQATFDAAHSYYARIVTNKGEMLVKLMPRVAPMHVSSFIYLARLGFYDGVPFHRVIKGFMAQTGCPLGTGTGNPGYQMDGEFSDTVKHDRPGRLSTANAGPGTDGSQFFLTFVPYPSLDGNYTIYGQVTEGLDVLKKLEAAGASGDGPPTEPLKMEKVTIEVK